MGTQGRHDLAVDWMRKASMAAPGDFTYRCNYLNALFRSGEPEQTQTELDAAIKAFPGRSELLMMKGILTGRQGDLNGAAELLQQAIDINPKSSHAYFNLSVIRRGQGDEEASLELLRKALELDPKNVQAVNNLAGALLDSGQFVEALRHLQRFLEIQPNSAQAYYNLSVALSAAGDSEQAIVALRNALKLDPKLKRGRFKLVNHLIASGAFADAAEVLDAWQESEPDEPRLLAVRARFLERQGKLDEATAVFNRIKMEDREIPAVKMCEATLLEVEKEYSKASELFEEVLEEQSADASESLGIRFSLGTLYDKQKQYDKAFENYRIGNELRHNGLAIPYDGERNAANFQKIANAYIDAMSNWSPSDGCQSNVPIFVIGMPRSGTSLTEQILGCHSKIHPAGELRAFSEAVQKTHGSGPRSTSGFTIVENEMAGHQSPVIPEDFSSETLKQIGQDYVATVTALANGEPHVSDKMPYNFLFLPMIKMALPNARIIHTRRNPADTCLSCFFQNFAGGSEFSFDLHDAGTYYRNYAAIMDRWRDAGIEMLEVDYEETVSDTETVVRRMLEFCGLDFEEQCLQAHKSKRPVVTASYQQVREPVYTKSVARWRNYQQHLGPLLEALGPLAD